MSNTEFTLDAVQARYSELCEKRDTIYAKIAQKRPNGFIGLFTGNYSLQEQLDEANSEVAKAQESSVISAITVFVAAGAELVSIALKVWVDQLWTALFSCSA